MQVPTSNMRLFKSLGRMLNIILPPTKKQADRNVHKICEAHNEKFMQANNNIKLFLLYICFKRKLLFNSYKANEKCIW